MINTSAKTTAAIVAFALLLVTADSFTVPTSRTTRNVASANNLHNAVLLKAQESTDKADGESCTSSSSFNPLAKTLSTAVVSLGILLLTTCNPLPALSSDFNSLSDEQKLVAEAWRLVDNSFLDRTFNGQDWFGLRQRYVKQRYKTTEEAQSAIEQMLSLLGDKYTRYLSPAKYNSLVNSATGTLAGVGIGTVVS
jgi:hypothetical protein